MSHFSNYEYLSTLLVANSKIFEHEIGAKGLYSDFLQQCTVDLEKKYPLRISDIAINGQHIRDHFSLIGREVGNYLKLALSFILQYPDENNLESILHYLESEIES